MSGPAQSLDLAEGGSDTPTRVLDAAEALFIERGFAATSVRAIAERAGVNLGAANYHFGSKQALFGAVVDRRFAPINEERARALEALLATRESPSVREVVAAFLAPLATEGIGDTPRLVARLFGEPASISRPLIEAQFRATFDRFSEVLARALPAVDATEIRWRLHFAIGAMIHTLATEGPIATPSSSDDLDRLAAFATAGIEGAASTSAPREETT